MSQPPLDEETLAAYLDNRLPPDERERVQRAIADDPDLHALFVEAAQVAREAATVAAPVPRRPARRWGRPLLIAGPLLAAAALALVVVQSRTAALHDVVRLSQQAVTSEGPVGGGSLPDGWDRTGWTVTRGAEPAAGAGLAARVGARMAQVQFAAGRDSVALGRATESINLLLGAIPGAGPLGARLGGLPVDDLPARAELARQVRDATGAPAAFDIGLWLETARLTATRPAPGFLEPSGPALSMLPGLIAALEREHPDGAAWAETLRHLRAVASSPHGLAERRAQVDSALAAIPR